MPAGRPAKPIAAHKRDGTYRKDLHDGRLDGQPMPGQPEMPEQMSPEGEWLWQQIMEGLPGELFGQIDTPALAAACDLWTVWQQGKNLESPQQFYMALSALKQCNVILSRFGWTPSDRARLHVSPTKEDPEMLRFFGTV